MGIIDHIQRRVTASFLAAAITVFGRKLLVDIRVFG